MQEYDVAFKLTLQRVDVAIRELTGTAITRWHNVEMPEIRAGRVDLLGETPTGELVHIELQSSNDPTMAVRMGEYCFQVFRSFHRLPHQIVLYVGNAPMRMEAELNGPGMKFWYRLVDVRELNGELLLESTRVGDNIIAVLTATSDARAAIHRVVERIAALEPGERETALRLLLTLAGLRKLGQIVEEEAKKMPILNDILEHEVLGREYKKGLEEGVQQGIQQGVQQGVQQGIQQGVHEGELAVLRRLIEKRFGALPAWAQERLSKFSSKELEDLSVRVLDAATLEELLG